MRVVLVVGTPGVGKTSVAKHLASDLNGQHVDLGDIVRNEHLSCGLDQSRGTLVADTTKLAIYVKEIIMQCKSYVIIDGHFAMDVVAVEDVFLVFVLRRNPVELRTILRRRGYKKPKIAENLAAEILDVCLFDSVKAYGEDKVCEINVSGKNVEDVVREAIDTIKNRKRCRIGIVDWLTRLESEGRLDEFFTTI
jgi:adenylate kinase